MDDEEFRIDELIGFLLQLVLEILAQIAFEFVTGLGWEWLKPSERPHRVITPVLAATGYFVMGICAGILSMFIVRRRLVSHSLLPGVSLMLAPLGTGLAMHWLGERWRDRGKEPPALFSFRAGAIFALGMALVRFVYMG